jgi:hypothetical protein
MTSNSTKRGRMRYLRNPPRVTLPKTRVEAGSNTSTVNLRVVRGDEMGLKKAAP